jgi:hypothetical protein
MSLIIASGTLYLQDSGGLPYYSTDGTNYTQITAWPVTIQNGTPASLLEVLFTTDMLFTQATQYFSCGSDNIQFGSKTLKSGGTRPIITIEGVTNYPGLIQNGDDSGNDGHNKIYVCNLEVHSSGSSLKTEGGWIGQGFFSRNAIDNYIVNCFSNGIISLSSGGIVGTYAASAGGILSIIGCETIGEINGNSAGGIIGSRAASDGGVINAAQCFSAGSMTGSGEGGIFGDYAGYGTSTNGTVFATNCYSTGAIGLGCGGIFGTGAGNATALACYSLGVIQQEAGGIFGSTAGTGTIPATASNCYSNGSIVGPNAGGIFGFSSINTSTANCYISNNNWNTAVANTTLSGTPTSSQVGGSWIIPDATQVNQPYELASMGYSPYSLTNIKNDYYMVDTASQTINAGDSTIASVLTSYPYAYTILAIDGNPPTSYPTITMSFLFGTITTTTATPPASYSITLRNQVNPYNVSIFNLTVLGLPPPPPVPAPTVESGIPECCQPNVCTMNPQETNYNTSVITQKKGGKAVDKSVTDFYAGVATGQRTAHSQPIFKSYYDYMNYLQGKYK